MMRQSNLATDSAYLEFRNGWAVQIKPDPRNLGVKWNVVVLLEGKPHYNNPIALGADLIGQSDEDVQDICVRIKDLGRSEEVEEGLDQHHFE